MAGTTLVMIVGLGCTKSSWTPDLLRTLAESREVLIFDNKGSGHSYFDDKQAEVSIEDFASSTLDLLEALEIQQPDILGWSMVRSWRALLTLHVPDVHSDSEGNYE